MAKINLLPWREERRKKLKIKFGVITAISGVAGIGLLFLFDMHVQSNIAYQQSRNAYILGETKKLENQIAEIDDLEKRKKALKDRMEIIQGLQGKRALIVHQFDELVRTVPDGVYLTSFNKKADKFSILGVAENNNRVTNFLRNLDASAWYKGTTLTELKAKDKTENSLQIFSLTVTEKMPEKPAEKKNPAEGSTSNHSSLKQMNRLSPMGNRSVSKEEKKKQSIEWKFVDHDFFGL